MGLVGAGSRVAGSLIGVGLGVGLRGVAGLAAGVRWWRGREAEAGLAAWQRSAEPEEPWRDPWDVWGEDG